MLCIECSNWPFFRESPLYCLAMERMEWKHTWLVHKGATSSNTIDSTIYAYQCFDKERANFAISFTTLETPLRIRERPSYLITSEQMYDMQLCCIKPQHQFIKSKW